MEKKVLSILLAVIMLAGMIPAAALTTSAAGTLTVDEYECLEVEKGAYIDTGIKPTQNTRIEMDVDVKSEVECWFGTHDGGDMKGNPTAGFSMYGIKGGVSVETGSNCFPMWPCARALAAGRHTVELDKGYIFFDQNVQNILQGAPFSLEHTLYLFALNDNGKAYFLDGQGTTHFHSCRIYEGGELVRNFVPAQQNGVPGLYDKQTRTFYTNLGSGKMTAVGLKNGNPAEPTGINIPKEYLEVENGAYIDTGFCPTQDTHVVMDVYVNDTMEYWFGVWDGDYNRSAFAFGNDGSGIYTGYGDEGGTYSSPVTVGHRHTVELDRNAVKVDGKEINKHADAQFALKNTLYLFMQNRKGSPVCLGNQGIIRCYSCQIYEGGELVRDFVPGADNGGNAGLYDVKNGTFYGNASSGSAKMTYVAGGSNASLDENGNVHYSVSSWDDLTEIEKVVPSKDLTVYFEINGSIDCQRSLNIPASGTYYFVKAEGADQAALNMRAQQSMFRISADVPSPITLDFGTDVALCSSTTSRGGIIYAYAPVTVKGGYFDRCCVYSGGGAIYLDAGGTVSGSRFYRCYSYSDGGAIYTNGSTTVESCEFSECSAPLGSGGAIYSADKTAVLSVKNSTFKGNSASSGHGNSIYCAGELSLENCSSDRSDDFYTADNNVGSVLSEGSVTVLASVASAAVFGAGGFLLGRKKKKPAPADGAEEDDE